jgi:hypothetical protein
LRELLNLSASETKMTILSIGILEHSGDDVIVNSKNSEGFISLFELPMKLHSVKVVTKISESSNKWLVEIGSSIKDYSEIILPFLQQVLQ